MRIHAEAKRIILALSFVVGFMFIISVTTNYVGENYGISDSCSCRISLPLIIFMLSSLGIFVGSLTYYILSISYSRERKSLISGIQKTLDFLGNDERKLLSLLIDNSGQLSQSRITELTDMDKVKVSRLVSRLEEKGIIIKEKSGMTNELTLADDLKRIFIEDG